ncbi:MAG: PucR family transcriptional regulator [Solirubrobacteraceae bacterium]
MSTVDPVSDPELLGLVATVARGLLPDAPEIGAGAAARIHEQVEEMRGRGVEEAVLTSCSVNCLAIVDAMAREVPASRTAPAVDVVQMMRRLVQHGLSWDTVMRAYRVGIAHVCEVWSAAVAGREPRRAVEVAGAGTAFLLAWTERTFEALEGPYRDEAERLARERALARVDTVRRALEEPDLDVERTGQRLGYDLGGDHVAFVVRAVDPGASGPGAIDRAVTGLQPDDGAGALTVRLDVGTAWCWVHRGSSVPDGEGTTPGPGSPGIVVGRGRPGRGLDGFRRSHAEAQEAIRVAALAGRTRGTVTFDREEIAALCSLEPDRCRRFVTTTLGPLAADEDTAARLRATLVAYFAGGSSFRATGQRLGIHHNTVRYRVAQAERLLGRTVDDGRLALELALHLVTRLGDGARVGARVGDGVRARAGSGG